MSKQQADPAKGNTTNLFISVKTFDIEGKTIGERVVDLYHFGTNNWLQKHSWWAMHHKATIEITQATPAEVDTYLAEAKAALVEKFNSGPPAKSPLAEAPTAQSLAA
jgi:hypothetical protein